MSTPEPLALPLDDLFAALVSHGFYLGVDTHIRLREYFDWFVQKTDQGPQRLKYQLAALLCHDAAGQERFYELFEQYIMPYLLGKTGEKEVAAGEQALPGKPSKKVRPEETGITETALPFSGAQATQPVLTGGKSGPVRVELKFPTNDLRIWNLAEIDQAVRPLREKEWATVLEWDIPATIRSTIRAGGMPTFELRRRKRAPQYLMLIDQRGPRDHLAGLYAELAAELNRRDVDTVHYFYDRALHRCWKDRRNYGTYTSIEGLHSEFAGSRLLIVGEPEALLDLPQLRPSNLTADLLDAWPNTALLCTRPTAEWGNAELTLCRLMPVVPANAGGLSSLIGQWAATDVHAPQYWKVKYPEATVPPVRIARPQDAETVLENLRYYLGRNAYNWLSAVALYPELHYELTALLHDESIPPPPGMTAGDWDLNRVWWDSLLRLSRLDWFRRGSIPLPAREQLRTYFDQQIPPGQRRKVWEQLAALLEFTSAPPGSFAADSLQVTIDWYNTERRIADPTLPETLRSQLGATLRNRIQSSIINDPLARRALQQPGPAATAEKPTAETPFRILWVDDNPENNRQERAALQDRLGVSIIVSTGTEDALGRLAVHVFDLVISDAVRADDHDAGMRLFRAMQARGLGMPFLVYTGVTNFDYYKKEFTKAGAAAVAKGTRELLKFVEEQVKSSQQKPEPVVQKAVKKEKQRGNKPLRIFMISAREDEALRDELADWLKPLEHAYQFKLLEEVLVDAPSQWYKFNKKNLETADVILYLLSSNLLSSVYFEQELNLLVERAIQGDPLLKPVILRTCDWEKTQLSRFRAANLEPVEETTDRISTWYDITWEIMTAIGRFTNELPNLVPAAFGKKAPPETRFETKLRERLEKIQWEQQRIAEEEPVMEEEPEAEQAAETEPPVSEQEENAPPVQSAANPQQGQDKPPEPPVIKEQIQQLIAGGHTEEALALLAQHSSDALLLQARYNNGKKQYNEGLIDLSEWQRMQAQINYGALELSRNIDISESGKQGYDYFISYTIEDRTIAMALSQALNNGGLKTWIDQEFASPGNSVNRITDEAIKQSRRYVLLLSHNYLKKFWTQAESNTFLAHAASKEKKIQIIPVRLGITQDELLDFSPTLAGLQVLEQARDTEDVSALAEKLIAIAHDSTLS